MKIKSSLIFIVVLLALSIIAVYTYRSKSKTSGAGVDGRDFSFKDTAAITKIFIADKLGHTSTLIRGKNSWTVNDKYACRPDAILNLLELIKHVEVKMAVDKATRKSVLKFMSSGAVKVEIYTGDELVKQFYVGHETPDSEGSYMLLSNVETGENYKDPYVCFIPGFKGYLMPRFITNENEWRDRVVLNYIPPQLSQIRVQHFDTPSPDSSFTIDLLDTKTFKLKNGRGLELPFQDAWMKQYLAYFQNISYEVLITGKIVRLTDSLSKQRPFCTISLKTTAGETKEYKFFRKKFEGEQDVEHGINYMYDPNRLYMSFEKDREWALIQYFVFGKLLITPVYFIAPAPVKK